MAQCEFVKQNGEQCKAKALRGATLCISHNPGAVELKRAATRKGGRNRRTPRRSPKPDKPITVRKIEDVSTLLFRTLEELRNGQIDSDVARSIAYLAGVTAKVFESVELEYRVRRVEWATVDFADRVGK